MSAALIALKVLVAVIVLATAPIALKRQWRLALALPMAVFQGFLPGVKVAHVYVPLAFWGGLMLWPDVIREFKALVRWKPTAILLGIVILYTISLLWSVRRELGLQPIGYFCQFLIIFCAVVAEGRRNEGHVLRMLAVTATVGLVLAFSVVLFRILPGLKLEYVLSSVSHFFISPNAQAAMYTQSLPNTISPGKSGGIAVLNANVAAAILAVLAAIALGLLIVRRRLVFGVLCLFLTGAIAFAGSKIGLILAAALSIGALHIVSRRYRHWRNVLRLAMASVALIGVLFWIGPKATTGVGDRYAALTSFVTRSDFSFSVREKIWAHGWRAFLRHPIMGQGFGGWQKSFPHFARKYHIQPTLPPHNTIIYMWSRGGLMAAILGCAFIFYVLRIGWRQLKDPRVEVFGMGLAMTLAFLWTFVHGMGTNFGLLGDIHMSPWLAALLGLGYLHRSSAVGNVDGGGEDVRKPQWESVT